MATKLKPLLDRLLSPNQTGFLKCRSILHGFHYAQQIVQSATKQKAKIAVFKADIYKAFDTLDWGFLLDTLYARGFPQSWIHCIQNKVLKGESKIILNAVAGKTITLKRGVRQGDPISPYLFNLSMDFLTRWMQRLTDLNFLSPPFPQCRTCLLYADDTLVFLKPTTNQMIRIALLFRIFGELTGLTINMLKSEIAITSSAPFLTQNLADRIHCKAATFPIKYLGLPMSDKNLKIADYTPLIERIQNRLTGWKASMLSIGGRIILVNSVLTAMPQFFMSAFLLPIKVLHRIDQIRRTFLWHGHKEQGGRGRALHMVNWALATRPRKLGGLGVRDIQRANQALLAKWLWQWHDTSHTWWKEATPMIDESDRPWNDTNGSPFWKAIARIAPAFLCSVSYHIGNGRGTKFWHDKWHNTPLKFLFPNLYQAAQTKHYSVNQHITESAWDLQLQTLNSAAQMERNELLQSLQQVQITQRPDRLEWLRKGKVFTVSSMYNFLVHTPSPESNLKNIWAIKAPLRVQIFAWLMLTNRLTTIDNLVRRGWYLPNMCIMCQKDEETVSHLFKNCQLAREIRKYIQNTFASQFSIPVSFNTVASFDILTDLKETQSAKGWEMTTSFILWRERCRRIFSDQFSHELQLVREIRTEYNAWFGRTPVGQTNHPG